MFIPGRLTQCPALVGCCAASARVGAANAAPAQSVQPHCHPLPGLCASIFADTSDMPDTSWSRLRASSTSTRGRQLLQLDPIPPGGFLVALDTQNKGKADVVKRFGGAGGGISGRTGIAIYLRYIR